MKKAVTLKNNYEFQRMYRKAPSAVTPCVVVYCRRNRLGRNRLGITVSTKLGKAVVRNRARRRLREAYRLAQPAMKQGYDLVLVARGRVLTAPWEQVCSCMDRARDKLGVKEG